MSLRDVGFRVSRGTPILSQRPLWLGKIVYRPAAVVGELQVSSSVATGQEEPEILTKAGELATQTPAGVESIAPGNRTVREQAYVALLVGVFVHQGLACCQVNS